MMKICDFAGSNSLFGEKQLPVNSLFPTRTGTADRVNLM
jgi:hypothetical protein